MPIRSLAALIALALICAVVLVLLAPIPVRSAEACNDLDAVAALLADHGHAVVMLDRSALKSAAKTANVPNASRGFVDTYGGLVRLGLEVDGCLLDPIVINAPLAPARLSGVYPFGTFA